MRKMEEILKIESNQKSTLKTMERLLKNTEKKLECFLCKQGVNNTQIGTMKTNFNIDHERKSVEARQGKLINDFEASLETLINSSCTKHSFEEAIKVITEEQARLSRQMQTVT